MKTSANKKRSSKAKGGNVINAAVEACAVKVLVLSTGHLPESWATPREGHETPPMDLVASMKGEYGWLVHTGHEDDWFTRHTELVGAASPTEVLLELLRFAQRRGFTYVLFDADGDFLPQFPIYDW